MQERIEQHFTHCTQKGCIKIYSEATSYYEDPPGEGFVCRVADDAFDADRHFTVRNDECRPIRLASIDKCLISKARDGKRCDCVFFEDRDVYFVEFKLRDETRDASEDKRIEERLEEAWGQLVESVLYFENNGLLEPEHNVRAYAFVGYGPIIPAPITTILNLAEEFDNRVRHSIDFDVKDNALF